MTDLQFEYHPHIHVKIWLSRDPSVFMNLENQIRLIDMRQTNPRDVIHLLYDSSLLQEQACHDLLLFCTEQTILPVDAQHFQTQLQTHEECLLYTFYLDEIHHLDAGGNLGVASDIIRWLSPSYQLGTYTDFDVPVDTTALPESLPVYTPLLLNIGSLQLGKKEFILANNDYVAIVDKTAAYPYILKIQRGLIDKLTHYNTDFMVQIEDALKDSSPFIKKTLSSMKQRSEALYIARSHQVNKTNQLGSRALRQQLQSIMTDPEQFLAFHENKYSFPSTQTTSRGLSAGSSDVVRSFKSDPELIAHLRDSLLDQLTFVKRLFFNKDYIKIKKMLDKPDDLLLNAMMQHERSLYLKSIVVCTTGPLEITRCLFNQYVIPTAFFREQVKPFSFRYYALQHSFQSKNTIALHEQIFKMLFFLGAETGALNDSSWLEEGVHLQTARQIELQRKQQQVTHDLPIRLNALRQQIELEMQRLTRDLGRILGPWQHRKKEQTLAAFSQLLPCFHKEPQAYFDVSEYRTWRTYHQPDTLHRRSQQILDTLEHCCRDAARYRIAHNQTISYSLAHTRRCIQPAKHNVDKIPSPTP